MTLKWNGTSCNRRIGTGFGHRYLLKVVALYRQSLVELAAVVAGVRRC